MTYSAAIAKFDFVEETLERRMSLSLRNVDDVIPRKGSSLC